MMLGSATVDMLCVGQSAATVGRVRLGAQAPDHERPGGYSVSFAGNLYVEVRTEADTRARAYA